MGKQVKDKIAFWEDVARKEAPSANPTLAGENSSAQDAMAAAPAAKAPSPLESMLTQHLKDTGRVDPLSQESLDKRETYSGKVLMDMEKSTQARQKAENATKDPGSQRPLTHAVSGHGKGTDQVGRLVHGRRNDEMMEDVHAGTTPGSSVSLTGNKHGMGDMTTPAYDKVGSDPKNISGAFSSHRGMLHAVTEGFAQASMLDAHQRQARKGGDGDATFDQSRFATQVSGPGENIGYNLTLDGDSQSEGDSVSGADMQSRFENIKRDDNQKNATVVMDPAFIDGKRAGWQVQTAFANNDAVGSTMANPSQVDAEVQGWKQKAAAEKAVSDARDELKAAKKTEKDTKSKANGAKGAAAGMQKGIQKALDAGKDAPAALVQKKAAKEQEAKDLAAMLPGLAQAVSDAEAKLDAAEKHLATLA